MSEQKEKCLNILRGRLDALFETNDWSIKRGVLRAAGELLDECACKPSPARAKALNELMNRVFKDESSYTTN